MSSANWNALSLSPIPVTTFSCSRSGRKRIWYNKLYQSNAAVCPLLTTLVSPLENVRWVTNHCNFIQHCFIYLQLCLKFEAYTLLHTYIHTIFSQLYVYHVSKKKKKVKVKVIDAPGQEIELPNISIWFMELKMCPWQVERFFKCEMQIISYMHLFTSTLSIWGYGYGILFKRDIHWSDHNII